MNDLSSAIVDYVGWGTDTFPKENADIVSLRFGDLVLIDVIRVIKDLQSVDPDWGRHDLLAASKDAVDQIRSRYQIDEDAASALEWTFSWWWK